MKLLATLALFGIGLFSAAADSIYRGSVRAADQFVPGATITAMQGTTKVIGYTDDSGRFQLQLGPGAWDIHVDMFGFTPRNETVSAAGKPIYKDWTLDMPRLSQPATPVAKKPDQTAASRPRPNSPRWNRSGPNGANGQNRNGANGQGPQPGFQNAQVRSAENSDQALAQAAAFAALPDLAGDANEYGWVGKRRKHAGGGHRPCG